MATQNFRVRNGLEVGQVTIDANTGNITATQGNVTVGNITMLSSANLGRVENVKMQGGSFGFYALTDGAGNLSFAPQSPAANAVISHTFAGNVNSFFGNSINSSIYLSANFSPPTSTAFSDTFVQPANLVGNTTGETFYTGTAVAFGSFVYITALAARAFRSSDGINWTQVTSDSSASYTYGGIQVVNVGSTPSLMIMAVGTSGSYAFSYKTSSDGTTWSGLTSAGFNKGAAGNVIVAFQGSGSFGALAFFNNDFRFWNGSIWLTGSNPFTPGGSAWLLYEPVTNRFYAGNGGTTVYYISAASSPTGAWSSTTAPETCYGVLSAGRGNISLICTGGRFYTGTVVAGGSFSYGISGTVGTSSFEYYSGSQTTDNGATYYAVPRQPFLRQPIVSTDNGNSWPAVGNTGTASGSLSAGVAVLAGASGNSIVQWIRYSSGNPYIRNLNPAVTVTGTAYQFQVPAYGTYPGNSNIYVQFQTGDNAAVAISRIYSSFANANVANSAGWTFANNPGGQANSFTISFNSRNNLLTLANPTVIGSTGANVAFAASNTAPTGNINTIVNSRVDSVTPILFDRVTVTDPINLQTASYDFYPGNTTGNIALTLVAGAPLTSYFLSSIGSQVTFTRLSSGQLSNAQFPTITITRAVGGNSSLTVSNTIVGYGQGGTISGAQLVQFLKPSNQTTGTTVTWNTTPTLSVGDSFGTMQSNGWFQFSTAGTYQVTAIWNVSTNPDGWVVINGSSARYAPHAGSMLKGASMDVLQVTSGQSIYLLENNGGTFFSGDSGCKFIIQKL